MVLQVKFNRNLFDYINKENGLTTKDAAAIMGLRYRALWQRMTGVVGFKFEEMIKWANYTGADLRGVFYVEEERE